MRKETKRIIRIISGYILIIFGIIGLFLPFLQGIALIFAGIMLISPSHGKKIIAWVKMKWQKLKKK